jgi:hypothetical protein
MTPIEAAVVGGGAVLALLGIVAWASAMQTLRWLGEAEDLLEHLRERPWLWGDDEGRLSAPLSLEHYKRRTPRRSR